MDDILDRAFVPVVLVALVTYLGSTNSAFLSPVNITNVRTQASILAICRSP